MIIFINGSVNAGKTTVSNLLARKLPKTAIVEIDFLRQMIDWMSLQDSIPLNLENAVSVIRNFVKKGLHVAVPYPLSEENYQYMIENLKDLKEQIHVFTLAPKLEKVTTNRGGRELTDWEKERIPQQYEKGIHNPTFGEIIDNSDMTPEETAEMILGKLQKC